MAAKKKAAKKAAKRARQRARKGPSTEKAVVGNPEPVKNKGVPDYVRIQRTPKREQGTKVTETASVQGDQTRQIINILDSKPVTVTVIEGKPLSPDQDGTLVHVQSAVTTELITATAARSKFARKPDGTIIYNDRGFDEVPGNIEFDLVDVVKLVEHNHKHGK